MRVLSVCGENEKQLVELLSGPAPYSADIADFMQDHHLSFQCINTSTWTVRAGKSKRFSGVAVTVRCFEDNSFVKRALRTMSKDGERKVMVIDGGGSTNCALLGGNLAKLAVEKGFTGIIVNGMVRDVHEIEDLDIGVIALGRSPVRSIKRDIGESSISVHIEGAQVVPGNTVVADGDGILVIP